MQAGLRVVVDGAHNGRQFDDQKRAVHIAVERRPGD
jgi:hypothetical protein